MKPVELTATSRRSVPVVVKEGNELPELSNISTVVNELATKMWPDEFVVTPVGAVIENSKSNSIGGTFTSTSAVELPPLPSDIV